MSIKTTFKDGAKFKTFEDAMEAMDDSSRTIPSLIDAEDSSYMCEDFGGNEFVILITFDGKEYTLSIE